MYQTAKSLVRALLPQSVLFRAEVGLREILYRLRYKGNRFVCNICAAQLAGFLPLHNGERLCPRCGSMPRNRRLWQILTKEITLSGKAVLDFSPSRCLFRAMRQQTNLYEYLSSDFENEFIADVRYDITAIPEPDNRFDLVICYHVLEHIAADAQAMRELYRVLRRGGVALIQTPFSDRDTYEDATIISPENRETHFGQRDHVRIYNATDLSARLRSVGFEVEQRVYATLAESDLKNGFNVGETVLICRK